MSNLFITIDYVSTNDLSFDQLTLEAKSKIPTALVKEILEQLNSGVDLSTLDPHDLLFKKNQI